MNEVNLKTSIDMEIARGLRNHLIKNKISHVDAEMFLEVVEFIKNDRLEQYSLTDVGSSLKVDKTHVGFDIITLKGSYGNEYVIDEGKVYREVITTKYVLVDENL